MLKISSGVGSNTPVSSGKSFELNLNIPIIKVLHAKLITEGITALSAKQTCHCHGLCNLFI
jgi:hypothetical protein